MELKKDFKKTEAGYIPNDWNIETLENLCVTNGLVRGPFGGSLKKEFFVDSGYKVYEQRNAIYRDHQLGNYFIDNAKYNELKRFALEEDDFIVSCSGTIGRIYQMPKGIKQGVINQALLKITTDEDKILDKFFFYYFDWKKFQERIVDNTQGGAMQNLVGMSIFRSMPFPVPLRSEQHAIAAALSDVDTLLTALDSLITKKRLVKQGAIQELLTGKKRLPGFSGEWKVEELESVTPVNTKFGIVDGPFGSNLKTIHYRNSGIPIITSGYVTEGHFEAVDYLYVDQEKFNQEKRSAVHPGDIVMAKIGARCGASAILPKFHEIGILSGNALKITVDTSRHSTYFIWQVLWNLYSNGNIEALRTVGAQPAISMPNLKRLPIFTPPLPEQQAIAEILSDMDAEISALETRREKTRLLKEGMMQELLTGRIRLL